MKQKKMILLLFVVVLCLIPVTSYAQIKSSVIHYPNSSYQVTVKRHYSHTGSMPKVIAYVDGQYGGYLYYVSHYYANYQVVAFYRGVVGYGYMPYQIPVEIAY